MKLSVIVLSYNTKNLTVKCIKSILAVYKESIQKNETEIILVDNASMDGTVEAISNLKPLKIIQSKENFGFSKGNNIGARAAKGDYVLFLNSDTEVKDIGFIKMTNFLSENKEIGILGGKLKNPDGSSQASAGKFYSLGNTILMLLGAERLGFLRESPRNVKRVDWVSGACMMVKKSVFDKLSGFDEKFFMYVEDMELCLRAKKAGYSTYFYPNLSLIHKEQGSGSREFAVNQIYKGLLHFYKKHKGFWQYILVKEVLTLKALAALILGILTNDKYLKNTYGKALRLAI